MTTTLAAIRDALYPPRCPVTGAPTDRLSVLAPEAWAGMVLLRGPARCDACGRAIPGLRRHGDDPPALCEPCHAQPRPWTRGAAAFEYSGAGRKLVLALKHADRLDLAPMLAGLMRGAAPELVAEADAIVPVPLAWGRMVARRFNQSAELARALARATDRPRACAPRLLARTRATPTQDGRDREARRANVAGAFAATRSGRARLPGARVLLVDDVMTTGATLEAAALALIDAGATRVDILVAALVPFGSLPYVVPVTDHAAAEETGQ